jgi:hypothetical protein
MLLIVVRKSIAMQEPPPSASLVPGYDLLIDSEVAFLPGAVWMRLQRKWPTEVGQKEGVCAGSRLWTAEIKQIHQIADRWLIRRNVGIRLANQRVW